MFRNLAGDDMVAQLEFAAGEGFRDWEDNTMHRRPLDEQQRLADAMERLGIAAVDESELVAICQELLAANPKIVADVQGGKQQAGGSLIGQAKKRNPNADPGLVRAICRELIAKL